MSELAARSADAAGPRSGADASRAGQDEDARDAVADGMEEVMARLRPRRPVETPRDRLPMRLSLGVLVTVGVIVVCWLIGTVGHRLGFAMALRVPEIDTGGTRGLVTGIMMLVGVPRLVIEAGIAQPLWLLAAFMVLAIPSSSLAAARPRTPGGPAMNPVFAGLANVGAVLAMVNAAGLIWWTSSSARSTLMRPLPRDAAEAATWPADLATAAGFDIFAVIITVLWIVLMFRLPIARWLKALAISTTSFTLMVTAVAMAMSAGTATQIAAQRSVILDENGAPALLVGRAGDREAVLTASPEGGLVARYRRPPADVVVVGRASVADVARDAAGE